MHAITFRCGLTEIASMDVIVTYFLQKPVL